MFKRVFLVFAVLSAVFLTSCTFVDEFSGLLGFDSYDYENETVVGSLETDGETGEKIKDMIRMLSIDSAELPEFDDMKDAARLCRDSMLNYMLNKNYQRYAGNPKLIEKASELYPEYTITQIIPASDYEAMMYEYFGGSVKISHGDGEIFKYLSKAASYIPSGVPFGGDYDIEITSLEETENTYRVSFTCSADDASEKYFALIIKREDETLYFKSVHKQ